MQRIENGEEQDFLTPESEGRKLSTSMAAYIADRHRRILRPSTIGSSRAR